MNIWKRWIRCAVGNCLAGMAGILLCLAFVGCGGSSRTVLIPAGEPLDSNLGTGLSGERADASAPPSDAASKSEDGQQDELSVIYVHVCGAVNEPGVVMLPEGSRGQDALEAAGGLTQDAAVDLVNLAQPLDDGMKLYFPTREEAADWQESEQAKEAGLVNINTAGVELLCTLPGIGEARAKAIVAHRETNGNFQTIEDIMQVSGIKESAFGKIRDLITVK